MTNKGAWFSEGSDTEGRHLTIVPRNNACGPLRFMADENGTNLDLWKASLC